MSRVPSLSSPFLIGFDQIERALDRVAKAADGYPPYNIEQIGDNGLRITLAVAGFGPNHLSVTVEDNQLVIQGRREGEAKDQARAESAYLHRGIAARAFIRTFVLADGMEVTGALLEHGLLHIDVSRIPPAKLVKRIPIQAAG